MDVCRRGLSWTDVDNFTAPLRHVFCHHSVQLASRDSTPVNPSVELW